MEEEKGRTSCGGTHNSDATTPTQQTSTNNNNNNNINTSMSFEATNPPIYTSWPPPSLSNLNVEALVNDCEDAEVSGQERPFGTVRCFVCYVLCL